MMADLPDWLGKPLAVVMIGLLLGGDNALVIALVCQALPQRSRRKALLFGTSGAIMLRFLLAGLAGGLLAWPGLKLGAGLMLALLALNLTLPASPQSRAEQAIDERTGVWAAIVLVMLFDLLMSLDNVLALVAVAGGTPAYLAAGLVLSALVVMFGNVYVAGLLHSMPALARFGAALLGWVAGQMIVTDSLLQGWVATQAPALTLAVPFLAAAYVYSLGGGAPAAAVPAAIGRRQAPSTVRPRSLPAPQAPAARAVQPEAADAARSERLVLAGLVALFVPFGGFLAVVTVMGGGIVR